jgi:hypothetical protein
MNIETFVDEVQDMLRHIEDMHRLRPMNKRDEIRLQNAHDLISITQQRMMKGGGE